MFSKKKKKWFSYQLWLSTVHRKNIFHSICVFPPLNWIQTVMDHLSDDDTNFDNAITKNGSSSAGVWNGGSGGGGGFSSIRDRFRFKRHANASTTFLPRTSKTTPSNGSSLDRQLKTGRSHHHHHSKSLPRKLLLFGIRERSWFYLCIFLVIFVFALASMVLQSSIMSVLRQGGGGSERGKWRWSVRDDLKLGTSLHFVPRRRFELRDGLNPLRNQTRIGIRPPRIALVCKCICKHFKIKLLFAES